MKVQLFYLPLAVLSFLVAVPEAGAQTVLIDENWDGYTPGAVPAAPWSNKFGGGSTPAPSEIIIVSQNIGGATSNWALVGNNASNEPVGNPNLQATFSMPADLNMLNVSFSFMIPANYGNASQEFFSLGNIDGNGQTTAAISLFLGPSYQGNGNLGYRTPENTRVNVGGNFVAGLQVNVNLLNINKAAGTYDLAWSTSGGGSGTLTGIAFTAASFTKNFNYISFGESSNLTSTSLLYVDNIRVEAIPEPGTAVLGVFSGLAFLVFRRGARR
jgi:hypothetical protein